MMFGRDVKPPPRRADGKFHEEDAIPWVVGDVTKLFLDSPVSETLLSTEGIFRQSASINSVQNIKSRYDSGEHVDLMRTLAAKDPHLAACLLKLWLRELPDALMTSELYDMFIAVTGITENEVKIRKLRQILLFLPWHRVAIVKHLFTFFKQVSKYSSQNQMRPENLALIIGPGIVRPQQQDVSLTIQDSRFSIELVKFCIEHSEAIFAGIVEEIISSQPSEIKVFSEENLPSTPSTASCTTPTASPLSAPSTAASSHQAASTMQHNRQKPPANSFPRGPPSSNAPPPGKIMKTGRSSTTHNSTEVNPATTQSRPQPPTPTTTATTDKPSPTAPRNRPVPPPPRRAQPPTPPTPPSPTPTSPSTGTPSTPPTTAPPPRPMPRSPPPNATQSATLPLRPTRSGTLPAYPTSRVPPRPSVETITKPKASPTPPSVATTPSFTSTTTAAATTAVTGTATKPATTTPSTATTKPPVPPRKNTCPSTQQKRTSPPTNANKQSHTIATDRRPPHRLTPPPKPPPRNRANTAPSTTAPTTTTSTTPNSTNPSRVHLLPPKSTC
ncbi:RhoGAP domain [Pelomyxa schiedti]|nr:RhoGAP domain [Pelomyxa schiedti]